MHHERSLKSQKLIRGFQVVLPPPPSTIFGRNEGGGFSYAFQKKSEKLKKKIGACGGLFQIIFLASTVTTYLLVSFGLLQSNKFFHDEDLRVNFGIRK